MDVHCVRVEWSTHGTKLKQIRDRVFAAELGIAPDLENDGQDADADHFLALNELGQPLGAARLLKSGQIGHLAVLVEHRRRGIGRQLLNIAIERATATGLGRTFIHVPRGAEAFCHKAGFRAASPVMADSGTRYTEMGLDLPIPFQPPETTVGLSLLNREQVFAESRPNRLIQFDSEYECRNAVGSLLANARRTVVLLSPTLDAQLFGADECLAAVSAFARRSRHTRMRILVEDTKAIAANSHPLLELARRLPSKVLIRRLPADREPAKSSYIVVDEEAVWMLPDRDAYVGWTNQHDRVQARRLADEFLWLFERSTEDPELRLLSL